MGGFVSVVVCLLAIISFYGMRHPIQLWMSVASSFFAFWSWGIMHNFAMGSAKARWKLLRENMVREGRPQEDLNQVDKTPIHIAPIDKEAVPNWLTIFNIIITFIGVVLFVWGIILRVIR